MLKQVVKKTQYELCIFVFLLVEIIAFVPKKDGMPVWQLLTYLGDYSHGYMPRAFLGEIISWFSDTVSLDLLFNLSFTVCVLLSLTIAILSGHIIKKAEDKFAAAGIVTLMVSSPIFMPLMANWLGIIDIYLILLTLINFVLNENKVLRFLIPVIALSCVAIHQAYMFLYMVPIAIALLYDFFKNKKFVRDGILCAVTYVSLIAFALFTVSSRTSGFSDIDKMAEFAISKADFPIDADWFKSVIPNEYFTGVDYLYENLTSKMSVSNLLGLVLIFAPVFILFIYGWIKAIKTSSAKDEKFVLFLCLIQPVSTVPAYIFGLNWNRWTSSIITCQCILYLFMLYRKNEAVMFSATKITDFLKKNFIPVIFYLIYYASFAKLLGF